MKARALALCTIGIMCAHLAIILQPCIARFLVFDTKGASLGQVVRHTHFKNRRFIHPGGLFTRTKAGINGHGYPNTLQSPVVAHSGCWLSLFAWFVGLVFPLAARWHAPRPTSQAPSWAIAAATPVHIKCPDFSALCPMAGFRCFVWTSPTAEDMELALMGPDFPTRTLNRPAAEPLQKCLQRLTLTLCAKKEKNKRKRGPPGQPGTPSGMANVDGQAPAQQATVEATVRLVDSRGEPVPLDGTNLHNWVEGRSLTVGDLVFPILLDVPRVRLELQTANIRVGCAVAPYVASSQNVLDMAHCTWRWHRLPADVVTNRHNITGDMFTLQEGSTMVQVGDHPCYVPTAEDVGYRLCVSCLPRRLCADGPVVEGPVFQCVSPGPVIPFPTEEHTLQPLLDRHQSTAEFVAPPQLRVLSYNLLADCYTNTTFAQNTLFPHCALAYLDGVYRRQLQLREVLGYHADVLCFQEVGRAAFQQHFEPLLQDMAYRGVLNEKAGTVTEGSATFWRQERLSLVKHCPLILRDRIRQSPTLTALVTSSPTVWEVLTQVSTVAQVTVLKDLQCEGRLLAVVNTHLFFHPNAPHIRALQVALILEEVRTILSDMGDAAVIFCGDFNATPTDCLYDFVCTGAASASSRMWWVGRSFKWGKGEDFFDFLQGDGRAEGTAEEVEEAMLVSNHFRLDLTHPYPGLRSTHAAVEGQEPSFTNLVPTFSGTLDYIFFQPDQLEALAVVPIPDRSVAVAMPSPTFPSDHMAVVADLQWRAPT